MRIHAIFISILLIVIASCLSCNRSSNDITPIPKDEPELTFTVEDEPQVITLDQAQQTLGTKLPIPTYSNNFEIQEFLLTDTKVILIMSDKQIYIEKKIVTVSAGSKQIYEVKCRLALSYKFGKDLIPVRLPETKVKINVTRGWVQEGGTGYITEPEGEEYKRLWWQWKPDKNEPETFEMILTAHKDFPNEELIKVAESVQ